MVTVVARGGFSVSPLFNLYLILFFFSSLFLSQLFLVSLNRWLLGLKWWVVSVVAKFGLVMMGFGGGHLSVGWVSRWRSGYGSRWRSGLRLGFWVSVVSRSQFLWWSVGASFVFWWCGSAVGFVG